MVQGVGTSGYQARAAALALALVALLAAPASGRAAVDFGDNLGSPATSDSFCASNCTLWNTRLHPANIQGSLAAPISGVVVSFTLRKQAAAPGTEIAPLHIRVVRPVGSLWSGLGASSPDVTPANANGLETFPVRVPIGAGDYLGVEFPPGTGNVRIFAPGTFFASMDIEAPVFPADGTPLSSSTNNWELLLRARVEPDADGDGFGDETQDKCAGKNGPLTGCPKKKCKKKKRAKGTKGAAVAKTKSSKGKKRCKKKGKKRK